MGPLAEQEEYCCVVHTKAHLFWWVIKARCKALRIACHGKSASPVVGRAVYAFIPEVPLAVRWYCCDGKFGWHVRLLPKKRKKKKKKGLESPTSIVTVPTMARQASTLDNLARIFATTMKPGM